MAEARGDTDSVAAFRAQKPSYRVLIADALRLVVPPAEPQACRDARWELRLAAERYVRTLGDAGSGEMDASLDLQSAHATVAELTEDVSGERRAQRPYEEDRTPLWD